MQYEWSLTWEDPRQEIIQVTPTSHRWVEPYVYNKSFAPYSNACEDIDVSVLQHSKGWQHYTLSVRNALLVKGFTLSQVEEATTLMRTQGCDALFDLTEYIMLCDNDRSGIGRSVRAFCPGACGCNAYNSDGCPRGCWCDSGACQENLQEGMEIIAEREAMQVVQRQLYQYDQNKDSGEEFTTVLRSTTLTTSKDTSKDMKPEKR